MVLVNKVLAAGRAKPGPGRGRPARRAVRDRDAVARARDRRARRRRARDRRRCARSRSTRLFRVGYTVTHKLARLAPALAPRSVTAGIAGQGAGRRAVLAAPAVRARRRRAAGARRAAVRVAGRSAPRRRAAHRRSRCGSRSSRASASMSSRWARLPSRGPSSTITSARRSRAPSVGGELRGEALSQAELTALRDRGMVDGGKLTPPARAAGARRDRARGSAPRSWPHRAPILAQLVDGWLDDLEAILGGVTRRRDRPAVRRGRARRGRAAAADARDRARCRGNARSAGCPTRDAPHPIAPGMATGLGVVLARRAGRSRSSTSPTPAAASASPPLLALWSLLALPIALGVGLVLGAGNATWGDRLGPRRVPPAARRRRARSRGRRGARSRRRCSAACSRSAIGKLAVGLVGDVQRKASAACCSASSSSALRAAARARRAAAVSRRRGGSPRSSRRSARCRAWSCSSSAPRPPVAAAGALHRVPPARLPGAQPRRRCSRRRCCRCVALVIAIVAYGPLAGAARADPGARHRSPLVGARDRGRCCRWSGCAARRRTRRQTAVTERSYLGGRDDRRAAQAHRSRSRRLLGVLRRPGLRRQQPQRPPRRERDPRQRHRRELRRRRRASSSAEPAAADADAGATGSRPRRRADAAARTCS